VIQTQNQFEGPSYDPDNVVQEPELDLGEDNNATTATPKAKKGGPSNMPQGEKVLIEMELERMEMVSTVLSDNAPYPPVAKKLTAPSVPRR